ncbi:DNA-binding response regulator [Corynebacterium suedekumii]|uniref:DNA-binding response regulator n=1 Tax=Corynebacterium suedekumii TaxID=3049801 RepID=A0ABY8VHM2_9CORY|nr:DNA-binding response regulator [Corynebacterium suedekumii]WIM69181.1 DNA-binding response regulator [Corynebacterium suedekumii]
MTSPDLPAPPLRIDDLLGNYVILDPTMQATVGRSGSFPVGTDDRYLHRILFQVWYSGQGWFLGNRGSHITLDVESRSVRTRSRASVGPGSIIPLPAGPSAVAFSTPERTYELHIDIPTSGLQRPQPVQPDEGTEATYERHTPTLEQRQLMDVLAEPLLKFAGASESDIPTVKEVAETLGWSEKKTHQKIERLCARLAQDGAGVYKPYRLFLAHYAAAQRRR